MTQPLDLSDPLSSAVMEYFQLNLAENNYHRLLAVVQKKYQIGPSGPHGSHTVSFEAYTDRNLESTEVVLKPRDNLPVYIEGLHMMFRSNTKALDGGILYVVWTRQFWSFAEYYHSPAKTTGRDDWDSMFTTLRTTPRRDVVPCMWVNTPFGCHLSNCPFHHPPSSVIAASRSSLIEARRVYLTTPTPRNRYEFLRNKCINEGAKADLVIEEAKTLEAVCDNGLCAKKAKTDGGDLLVCSGCGWARYCSVDCQKLCRKRHKMVEVDLLIKEEHLWTKEGDLEGQPSLRSELGEEEF